MSDARLDLFGCQQAANGLWFYTLFLEHGLVTYAANKSTKTALYALSLKRNELQEQVNGINTRLSEASNKMAYGKYIGQVILQVMTKAATNADFSISYFTRNAGWFPNYDLRVKTLDNSFKLTYKASVTQSTGLDWKNVKLNLSTNNPNMSSAMPILNPAYLSIYAPVLYQQFNEVVTAAKSKRELTASSSAISADDAGNYAYKDLEKKAPATVTAFTTLTESQLNTNFEIDLPYDIPSDGKAYSVAIKEEELKAAYHHYAVPKLDRDAFLVAEITNWQNLDLLAGEANIIMDNVYIGKSSINPNTTVDTLKLSLGRDKRVAIKRTLVKELSKQKVKGDNKSETFVYETVVRNNKKQSIDITITDQVPVSKVKEVEVNLDDKGNALVDDESGILTWNLKLAPGESKTIRFGYTIKYPKDKTLQGQR